MKILFLITDLDPGGAERMLHRVVLGARAAGHEVLVASLLPDGRDAHGWASAAAGTGSSIVAADHETSCLGRDTGPSVGGGEIADWLRRDGISVETGLLRGRFDPLILPRLVALLHRFQPDLLHTWLFHANLLGRLAAKLAGVPRVISSIRVYDDRPWHHRLDRWTLPLVEIVTVNSPEVKRRLVAEQGYPPDKLVVIPNGVELRPTRPGFPTDLARSAGKKLVVTVSRQHPQKGLDVLLRSVPEIVRAVPAEFWIVGREDTATPELQRLIAEMGLGETVRLLGWRADARDLTAHADLFVLPSRFEGMPNALLEAMAEGTAAVATAVDGSRDLVVDGETGVLVPPDDAAALAAAVVGLLRDDGRRAALGAAARARAVGGFSLDAMVTRTRALYLPAPALPAS